MRTVGATLSKARVRDGEAELGFPAASDNTPAAMVTLTGPCPEGTTSKSNADPEPERLAGVPLLTLIHASVKPVTGSVNTAWTGSGDSFVGSAALEFNVTPGGTLSNTRVNWAAAVFVISSGSVPTPSGTSTVTRPCPEGSRSN